MKVLDLLGEKIDILEQSDIKTGATEEQLSKYLPLVGGTMEGDITMGTMNKETVEDVYATDLTMRFEWIQEQVDTGRIEYSVSGTILKPINIRVNYTSYTTSVDYDDEIENKGYFTDTLDVGNLNEQRWEGLSNAPSAGYEAYVNSVDFLDSNGAVISSQPSGFHDITIKTSEEVLTQGFTANLVSSNWTDKQSGYKLQSEKVQFNENAEFNKNLEANNGKFTGSLVIPTGAPSTLVKGAIWVV